MMQESNDDAMSIMQWSRWCNEDKFIYYRVVWFFHSMMDWIRSSVTMPYSSAVIGFNNLAGLGVSTVFKVSAVFMAWLWLTNYCCVWFNSVKTGFNTDDEDPKTTVTVTNLNE